MRSRYPAYVIGILAVLVLSALPGANSNGVTLAEVAMGGILAVLLVSAALRYRAGAQLLPEYAVPVGVYVVYAFLTVILAVIYRNHPMDVLRDVYQLLPLSLAVLLPFVATKPEHIHAVMATVFAIFLVGIPEEIQSGLAIRPVYRGLHFPLANVNLPESLALHWSTVAPFAVASLILAPRRSVRWGAVAVLLLAVVAALGSLSRSAIAAAFAGCAVTLVEVGFLSPKALRSIFKVALFSVLFFVLLIVLLVNSDGVPTRVVDYLVESFANPMEVGSLRLRVINNARMVEEAVRSYLLGYGLGYRVAVAYSGESMTRALTPDNSFLYILVKFGLIGLGLYLNAVARMFRCAWRVAVTEGERSFWRIYALGYIGAMVSMYFNSFFNNTAIIFSGNLFLGLSTGIIGWRMLETARMQREG